MRVGKMVLAAAVALVAAAPLAAQSLTYTTAGMFNDGAGCNGTSCTRGGFTINFQGLGATTVVAPTNISYGEFITTGAPPAGTFAAPFTLTVTQTNPAAGSGVFSGTVAGTMTLTNSGTVRITFSNTTLMLGASVYQLDNAAYNINPPATNGGLTSIQGSVSTIPEPATVVLLGSGIAALGLFGVRRRNAVTQA